ncbi:MAG TPA: aspartate-semialdehyde dehydrogenase, partial [Candidatus Altiarchaeales archaeon]|nr:aspartate-semialdehyde dehydrogenase [Candidatus Altiarchaeales archaeon]
GILGATGMVGQRFIQLLEEHPWFEIGALMASSRSAGKMYKEVAKWYLKEGIPKGISEMIVEEIDKKVIEKFDLDLVFSAIPSDIAREIEGSFALEIPVFSNTATYRMDDDVPLIIPEVNPEHLSLIKKQKKKRGWDGFIVTNPNCTTIGLVIPLKPIVDKFGIEWVNVATMQALSGAGYDGVPSMAILDNVIPFIRNEEEKVEVETAKILGSVNKTADFDIFASCNRVNVRDGHTESVFVKTEEDFDVEDLKERFRKFRGEPQELKLPTAPDRPIVVMEKEDRPQPIFDRDLGNGMSVSVGRIRRKKSQLLKFTCLSHNTIRGAAGASVLNAELAYKKKLF